MFWCYFVASGSVALVNTDVIMNSAMYQDISAAKPGASARRFRCGHRQSFQQDDENILPNTEMLTKNPHKINVL